LFHAAGARQHVFGIMEAFVRLFGERPLHETLPVAKPGRQSGQRRLHMRDGHRHRILGLVGQVSGEHFPGQDAHAVEIGTQVHLLPARLFGGHVGGAADGLPGQGDPAAVTAAQGDAEIGQQRAVTFIKQDVFGFDITVNDSACMRKGQGGQQGFQGHPDPRMVAGQVALAEVTPA